MFSVTNNQRQQLNDKKMLQYLPVQEYTKRTWYLTQNTEIHVFVYENKIV